MLLLPQNTFLNSPLLFSFKNHKQKVKIPTFGIHEKKRSKSRVTKLGASYCESYTHVTASHHTQEFKYGGNIGGGIGIDKFFQGKNIFLTGATGFLGKALVEKLLRSTLVDKIYILVKASDKEAALDRLLNEIIGSDLFECLREKHGSSYEEFVRTKVIPVVGNICEPNMGMDALSAQTIMDEVDVIIQSAATTAFNDRYDVVLDVNVNAPQRLMRFAKRCKNLELFVHISTAYVNGEREGVIYEEPLMMGQNGRNDNEEILFPLDLTYEMSLAMKQCIASTNVDANKDLKKLSVERAAYHGWYNSYTMSKALGEMAINEIRQNIPLLIIRPSIIESTYKEPFPGWILGNRMLDPVVIAYGKGTFPAVWGNPEVILDVIPADMVVNTIIAATAKHGINLQKSCGVSVYNVASSIVNPLLPSEFFEYLYDYFKVTPLVKSQTINRIKFFDNFNDFSKYTKDEILRHRLETNCRDKKRIRKIEGQCNVIAAYAEQICKIYEFAAFFRARFDSSNTLKLIEEMSKEEQVTFDLDARNIDWKKYFHEIHLPGLSKYIFNNSKASV